MVAIQRKGQITQALVEERKKVREMREYAVGRVVGGNSV
jgi:hypothetical protein